MARSVTNEDRQAILKRLERYSRLTDSAVRIPFTRIAIGVEPVIGLVPVIGDFAGLILSGYVLAEAQRAGASRRVKAHMVKNILVDAVIGTIPVLGDAFDVIYKANIRNTRLLKEDLERHFGVEQPRRFRFSPGPGGSATDADASETEKP